MGGAGQRKAILNDVRATRSDRPNVRGLNLGFSTAIQYAKPCHGAPVIVSLANMVAEVGLANLSIEKNLLDPSRLLRWWCFEVLDSLLIELERIKVKTNRVDWRKRFAKTGTHDRRKISLRDDADRLALQIGADATRITNFAQGRLGVGALVCKWHWPVER